MKLARLPIDDVLGDLIDGLRAKAAVVLKAPPGAGKTTRVPPAIIDAGLATSGRVVLLQPRRVAARAAAERISHERGTPLGGEVGYQVRFERRSSAATRILAVTEGIFLRMLADDPFLEGTGVVIFDEFHERSLDADLALAMVRRVQREVRPDLKVVVMSATLDPAPLAAYFDNCPTVESVGRLHPVAVHYAPHDVRGPIAPRVAATIDLALSQTTGDLLVFLPGLGEIRVTEAELKRSAAAAECAIMSLYGDLPLEDQQRVLRPAERRKIVLATNVVETSITIEGITTVVDAGLARVLRFDSALGLDRLELARISRASAEQRAGRAGRLGPGVCFRLWTEREQRMLRDEELPEIKRVDLAGATLQLLAWGETDLARFEWFEPPPKAAVEQATALLTGLGAIDVRGPTALGRRMARLPVHPRLARMLLEGARLGALRRAALAAALLAERDPFRAPSGGGRPIEAHHTSDSDVLDRVMVLEGSASGGEVLSAAGRLNSGAARQVTRAAEQLARLAEGEVEDANQEVSPDEALLRALLAAYPDRVARRREPGGRRFVLVGGRGARLADESAVDQAELIVAVDVQEIGRSEALIRLASAIERQWLPPEQLKTTIDVEFDPRRQRVVALRRVRFGDLVLREDPTALPPEVDPGPVLAKAAAELIGDGWQLSESDQAFLARVDLLRRAMPDLDLPDLGEHPLVACLEELCAGRQSLEELRRVELAPIWMNRFTGEQRRALERDAPLRIQVPSGRALPLEYSVGKPPVLAVRIQELFGLRSSPRVAGGRVPVVLHLLGPNFRPQQVTDDLESFWTNTYPQVRKDLRRRYPKHAWPEDPWTAKPESRPQRKQR